MDRLLIDHEWYFAIGRETLLEHDYQEQLLANAPSLFPHFVPIRFSLPVRSEGYGSKAPDFLLIERKLRTWWIVEAEMARHSLSSHVEPQVAALSHARITDDDAIRIAAKAPTELDTEQLKALVLSVQANVLVLVDADVPEWPGTLQLYGATVVVVQPFQSRHGRFAFRQRGEIPGIGTTFLSSVVIRQDVSRALIIENRSAVKFTQGQEVELFVDGSPTSWRCHAVGNTMMMFYLGSRFPFEAAGSYHLVELPDSSLAIEKLHSRIIKG